MNFRRTTLPKLVDKKLFPVEVGTIIKSTRRWHPLKVEVGQLGVVIKVYEDGYRVLFSNGESDGFRTEDFHINCQVIGFCESLSDYEFTSVIRLYDDFRSGRFKDLINFNENL